MRVLVHIKRGAEVVGTCRVYTNRLKSEAQVEAEVKAIIAHYTKHGFDTEVER